MRSHKSLIAWQVAREVVSGTLDATSSHWHPSKRNVFDQLERAALSVQLNIAEAYARGAPKPFRNHLRIAYASSVELSELLEIVGRKSLIPRGHARQLYVLSRRAQALILALLRSIREK